MLTLVTELLHKATRARLQDLLVAVQILFYVAGAILALLTYLSAKRGLLSPINTEIHKRSFDKIEALMSELISEFDPKSDNYWAHRSGIDIALSAVNAAIQRQTTEGVAKSDILFIGVPSDVNWERLDRLLRTIKTEPFLPPEVKHIVATHLEQRCNTLFRVTMEEITRYQNEFKKGAWSDNLENNAAVVHNRILDKLYEQNCGVSQIESQVHGIREEVAAFLSRFDPLKGRPRRSHTTKGR